MLQKVIFTQKSFKITKINGIEKHGFGVDLRQNHPGGGMHCFFYGAFSTKWVEHPPTFLGDPEISVPVARKGVCTFIIQAFLVGNLF